MPFIIPKTNSRGNAVMRESMHAIFSHDNEPIERPNNFADFLLSKIYDFQNSKSSKSQYASTITL